MKQEISMARDEATEFDRGVGDKLRLVRLAQRLSQADLAAAMTDRGAPLTQQVLTRIERGVRPLKLEEAVIAAATLGMPVTALLGPEQNPA